MSEQQVTGAFRKAVLTAGQTRAHQRSPIRSSQNKILAVEQTPTKSVREGKTTVGFALTWTGLHVG